MQQMNFRYYTYNIRKNGEIVDYVEFFNDLVSRGIKHEIDVAKDYTAVLTQAKFYDGFLGIVFFGGDKRSQQLYYDSSEAEVFVSENNNTRWNGRLTHALIHVDSDKRILALESSRGIMTPLLVERYLERFAGTHDSVIEVDLNPLTDEAFQEELKKFTRIRLASIEVSKPNPSWSDYENKLIKIADESDGQSAQLKVKASRGESLNLNNGIVEIIEEQTKPNKNSNIKNVEVVGNMSTLEGETTLRLGSHQLKTKISFDRNRDTNSTNIFNEIKKKTMQILGKRDDGEM